MRRRELLAGLGSGFLAWPSAGRAQQSTTKPRRVAILSGGPLRLPLLNAFLDQMRMMGWEQGRNFVLDARHADAKPEMFGVRAAELVALSPDLIVAPNSQSVSAAIAHTTSTPVVMIDVSNPVEAGFVKSLASSGSNVTGTTNQLKDVASKHYELLREVRPGLERMGVIFTPSNAGSALGVHEASVEMRRLGITLIPLAFDRPSDLDGVSAMLVPDGPQAVVVHPTPVTITNLAAIAKLALERRLPTVTAFRFMAQQGLLLSYGSDMPESWRRAAVYVDKLLRGESPSNLPIEQPTKFEFVINLRTARALGLAVPATLLARADEVIE